MNPRCRCGQWAWRKVWGGSDADTLASWIEGQIQTAYSAGVHDGFVQGLTRQIDEAKSGGDVWYRDGQRFVKCGGPWTFESGMVPHLVDGRVEYVRRDCLPPDLDWLMPEAHKPRNPGKGSV